jgi:hypothetical protein
MMPRKLTARALVRQVTDRLHPDAGCHDGGCVFGHLGGMQTNGGCQCLKEPNPALMRRNLLRLADVARELAAFCSAEVSNPELPSKP